MGDGDGGWHRGDVEGFRALFEAHYPRALRAAYLITGDRGLAEDATIAAFWRIWRARGRFRPEAPFLPWLMRIVLNEARRLRPREIAAPAVGPDAEVEADPEALALATLDRARVRRAIRDLPAHHRLPLVLRYYLDLDEREIAEILGIPAGTVKSRLHAARRRLARCLATEGGPHGRLG